MLFTLKIAYPTMSLSVLGTKRCTSETGLYYCSEADVKSEMVLSAVQ